MNQTSNRRIIILSLIGVLAVDLIIAGYILRNNSSHTGKIAVKTYVLPTDAKLSIDGNPVKPGTIYLSPGKHVASASSPGWKDETTNYNIQSTLPVSIEMSLTPDSSAATSWMNAHQALYNQMQQRGGDQSQAYGDAFRKLNPIVKQLPYKTYLYTIGYIVDPSDSTGQSIIVTVDAVTGYRNAAIQGIRNLGFDPTDLKINFRNYEDPFSS